MAEGAFKTDDMTLATMLAIQSYSYTIEKLTNRKALWVFLYDMEHEEDFDDQIADYAEFSCKVEPRQFVMKLAEMRSEVYNFMHARLDAPTSAA